MANAVVDQKTRCEIPEACIRDLDPAFAGVHGRESYAGCGRFCIAPVMGMKKTPTSRRLRTRPSASLV